MASRSAARNLPLQEILFTQGFGTRRICSGLVQQGLVQVGGAVCTDPWAAFDLPEPGGPALMLTVQGVPWQYQRLAYIMLNKPAGTECSQKPGIWPSVYTLLPGPLRQRPNAGKVDGVQCVGRLDQDTTGLLLLSDDGVFIHRMASPKHHVAKVYEVNCADPVTAAQITKLLAGVVLDDDPKPVRAAGAEQTGECALRLTLTQGKYHQVKRMLAAVGNRVVGLHRSRIGGLQLPEDLAPGQWRWLTDDQLARAQQKAHSN